MHGCKYFGIFGGNKYGQLSYLDDFKSEQIFISALPWVIISMVSKYSLALAFRLSSYAPPYFGDSQKNTAKLYGDALV